ncbi:recombination regulator RecX [Kosakonia radicincitans DSM 16656]|uniref:Regulatory protein RecX n=1 Tax=Kosakonia radicincitans TaxID=283686 RepID=A0AAX2EQK1_9ENTR|nr:MULTISPECIES: recombination regulator RecX [Kosakonia]MDP9566019.1 regulatory protein [Kosakonia oryzae]ARD59425.1 recombination regulator RecX [Kosakonia radicincitans DSM 16656]KDE33167.1 recombination regulator RecX [Kosakonia radicincitans UMEnt01/12]NCF08140.1 recombination regulator RecX [Kosakonia sp. MH5]PTA88559.1 recombination regulator RecX [Kosakonia sp. H7A]
MSDDTPRRSALPRLRDRAMRILAMRDHSEKEFRRKLTAPVMGKNGPEELDCTEEEVVQIVEWCLEHHFLDDARFVRQFIASRARKGYGPVRIRQELNQKGIARETTEQAMRECDIDWVASARDQALRKYGEPLPTEFVAKVKVQRFLLYRGFLQEDIQEIWRNFAD